MIEPSEYGLSEESPDNLLFSHTYQPPRGREGAPLMMLPIWFPVATPPVETMTLSQIIYRSLASVREPFRKTRIVAPNNYLARRTYTELLARSLDWAKSNFGAAVFPVGISLKRLAERSAELTEICERITQERKLVGIDQHDSNLHLLLTSCRRVIELGSNAPTPQTDEMLNEITAAIDAGNAWIIVEDDRESEVSLKSVKKVFDLLFGESGISHTAIILVTSEKNCRVLSDTQTFWLGEREKPQVAASDAARVTSKLSAAICRGTAFWGSPSAKVSAVVVGMVTLALLTYVVRNYERVMLFVSSFGSKTPPTPTAGIAGLVTIVLIIMMVVLPFVVGYVWGLAYGSEEVRRSSVDVLMTSLLGGLAFLLTLLPKSMDPGVLKTIFITLAALPGSALSALALVSITVMLANVVWLLLSMRITNALGPEGLKQQVQKYKVVLHIGSYPIKVELPVKLKTRRILPLLVSFKGCKIIPLALSAFPRLIPRIRRLIFDGLKKNPPEGSDFTASSLLLVALEEDRTEACIRCLRLVADDCDDAWGNWEEFGEYRQPSTTFRMNALEYAGRQLCYFTDREELIVIR